MASPGDRTPPTLRTWQAVSITFVAYLLAARLALLLAEPPSMASPLFPAAGIALVAALVWGRAVLPAIALASMAANLWLVASNGTPGVADAAISAAIGAGAALQAGVGAALVRRYVGQPLLLAEPSQLGRFLVFGALLGCCVSASVGLGVLWSAGRIGAAQALPHWTVWWVGDTLGVLIFAPLVLTLIGQPREEWAPRRWPVALPLLVATLLMGLGIRHLVRLDTERQRHAFEREAESAANAVQARLLQPMHALEAMHGLLSQTAAPDRDAFRRASAPWLLGADGLAALGWNERVARAELPAFEAREQAAGSAGFRVFERRDGGGPETGDADAQVIRFIEPLTDNRQALGLDVQSVALARAAIAQAARRGTPVASAGFTLTQGGTGVVVYQAVYRGQPSTAAERAPAQRGVVFATLRPDLLLHAASATLPGSFRLCLLDNDSPASVRVLAGPPGCDNLAAATPLHVVPLTVAGRQWDLRIFAAAPITPGADSAWPFAVVGLLGAAMLGALLLVVTGRARRIAAAVESRTAELHAEVAERERTGAALRDSQQRLRNILDHAPIGVAYTDTDGRIREANPKLREMLGLDAGRLALSHIADLLHPDDRQAEALARQRLLADEVPMSRWQWRYLTADGRQLWAQVGVSVLREAQGGARRMVWVVEDVTEHVALEEAQRARRGAEAANQAKSEFLSHMSHELRTPLNAMLGFTQLLELDRRQPLAPYQLEWTAQVRHAGWHLLHMINDTLDLTRIETGHIELNPRALDLAELVGAAVSLLTQNTSQRRVHIDVRLVEQARAVLGDHTRVKQILTNLLSNAIKYNVEGGRVIVSSRVTAAGRVALDVSDSGAGMNAAQLAQLFQPFNRLGREAGPVEGTGIGLVISLRLAELMGGSLAARSNPGAGSTFTLELPSAAAAPTPPPVADSDAGPSDASYGQRLVHYIEDNEANAEVMRGILALRPQVKLEVSLLGLEGLAAVRRCRPSLILLDMHLPDIDGLELLHRLQADPATADIPVIVVSADATPARINEAIAAGAAHYLTKPVNVPQCLATVDNLLEQLDTMFL